MILSAYAIGEICVRRVRVRVNTAVHGRSEKMVAFGWGSCLLEGFRGCRQPDYFVFCKRSETAKPLVFSDLARLHQTQTGFFFPKSLRFKPQVKTPNQGCHMGFLNSNNSFREYSRLMTVCPLFCADVGSRFDGCPPRIVHLRERHRRLASGRHLLRQRVWSMRRHWLWQSPGH